MKKKTLLMIILLPAIILLIFMSGCKEKTGDTTISESEIFIKEGPLDITDMQNLVSVNYLLWFNPSVKPGMPIFDISEIFREAAESNSELRWGNLYWFHFMEKPDLGYYRSDDTRVIREHMRLLQEAGVDFLVVDNTNPGSSWLIGSGRNYNEIFVQPAKILLDTMLEMRNEGEKTPYIVFWPATWERDPSPESTGIQIYEDYYKSGKYDELFVYMDGKPLLAVTDLKPEELKEHFTLRKLWGLQNRLGQREWSFLQLTPQLVTYNEQSAEHISISPFTGHSYANNYLSSHSKRGGMTFASQWKEAFSSRPDILLISTWNEWIAQRHETDEGITRFVDGSSYEYGRDLEPSKSGYKDFMYRFMKEYISAYKAGDYFPVGNSLDKFSLSDFSYAKSCWKTRTGGWKQSENVRELKVKSLYGDDMLTPHKGLWALEVTGEDNSAELVISRDFSELSDISEAHRRFREFDLIPLDLENYTKISIAVKGKSPNEKNSEYVASMVIRSLDKGSLKSEIAAITGEGWHIIESDISNWEGKSQIQGIDIHLISSDSDDEIIYYIDDFSVSSDGYVTGSSIDSHGNWEINSRLKKTTITRTFAQPMNLMLYDTYKFEIYDENLSENGELFIIFKGESGKVDKIEIERNIKDNLQKYEVSLLGVETVKELKEIAFEYKVPLFSFEKSGGLNVNSSIFVKSERNIESSDVPPYEIDFNFPGKDYSPGSIYEYKIPKAVKTPDIDGIRDENEWEDGLKIDISYEDFVVNGNGSARINANNVKSLPMASGEAYIKWNKEGLYIMADIKDSNIVMYQPEEAAFFMQDCLQILIDPANTGISDVSAASGMGTYIFDFAPVTGNKSDGPASWYEYWNYRSHDPAAGIITEGRLTKDGYYIEIMIPWNAIGQERFGFESAEGQEMRFGIVIYDYYLPGENNNTYWDFGNGIKNIGDSGLWNKIILSESK